MDSRSRLDYALFQLTPTRTRCDLVICAGDCKEKLASGLLEPFIVHLEFAKDQISKGGYSITLSSSALWFTKFTIQRFVKFVNTPEILERFVTIEREITNIDCSINTNDLSNKSEDDTNDVVHEEDSKVHLQRVLETRKKVLQKEQAMVYARAVVAGFDTDNLEDLIYFADAFGSPRLREACLNFMELCNTKSNDRIWMDDVAAMQASSYSPYEYLETSNEHELNQELMINNIHNNNFAYKKQNGNHLNQYIHNLQSGPTFQAHFQGYPFPYHQQNLPWSQNVEDSNLQSGPMFQAHSQGYPFPYHQQNLSWSQNMKDSNFDSVDSSSESESDKPEEEEEEKVTKQWDTFQNLLMKDDDDKITDEITKNIHTNDSFILVENDLFDENNNDRVNVSRSEKDPKFEDSFIVTSEFATESSANETRDIFEDHFTNVKSMKDVFLDEHVAVHDRSVNELNDSRLGSRDFVTVSKKKVEAEWVSEPNDLYIVLERDSSEQKQIAVWSPEMESQNSNDKKIIKVDSKNAKAKAKSKDLVGSVGEMKSDIISRNKKSLGTKTAIPKRKSEKEEEKTKKMEELRIQRQKRIAERSGSTAKSYNPKSEEVSFCDVKKTKKPFIRSSTIDRLSTARVVNPKVLPSESKPVKKPIKMITKKNDESKPAKNVITKKNNESKPMKMITKKNSESKPMKVINKNGESKPVEKVITKKNGESKPMKVIKKIGESKPVKKVITKKKDESKPVKKVVTKKNGESKPVEKPTKVITKENGEPKPAKKPNKNGVSSTSLPKKTIGDEMWELKPKKVDHQDEKTNLKDSNTPNYVKEFPVTSSIKKVGNGVSSVLEEDNGGSSNKAIKFVSFKEKCVDEISTPERSKPRMRWSNLGASTKAFSGFRKLLSFGKKN